MNFRKTNYKIKQIKKNIKDLKFSTQSIINKDAKKLVPNLSCRNYFHKVKGNPLFMKTLNQFNLDKTKLKNSSSLIFQRNDVDLVHNLNFDNMGQINDNTMLRENLINALQNDDDQEQEEEKMDSIFHEKFPKNENDKDQIQLPKLKPFNALSKYKSYELIESHRRKIKIETSEQLQKELINKLKSLRGEAHNIKNEKNEIYRKIKKIEYELQEIEVENYFSKENYKKQLDNMVKKTIDERKEEVVKNKAQTKLGSKKKKFVKSGNLMEMFMPKKIETNNNNTNNSQNNNNNKSNVNTPIQTPKTNKLNDPIKNLNKKEIINLKKNIESDSNNMSSNQNNQNSRPSLNKKSLEIFKMNILQTQKKKEFENFQNSQKEKTINLKNDLKLLEKELNKLDKQLDNNRKEEREIINRLMLFYKEILFKGKNVKKDGLVWIIKAIWYLGENVPMSFMPEFLDFDSIEYLFELAHKQLEIEFFTKKIRDMKLALKKDITNKYKKELIKLNIINKSQNENNNHSLLDKAKLYFTMKKESNELVNENKKDVYRDLVKEFEEKNLQFEISNLPEISKINSVKKHVEKIKNDIIELKKNEIKRISKCFIENNYEEKYHTNIETVLSALIGTDAKDTEMNKYNTNKKIYIAKLKKIRFFDHEHIRKILSK